MCNYVCVLGILATTGPGGQLRRDYSVQNRRSLHYATPDFLLKSVALSIFMRLSLTKAAYVVVSGAAKQEIRVRSGRDDKFVAANLTDFPRKVRGTADPSASLLMTSGAWGKCGRALKPKEGLNGPPKTLIAGVASFVIHLSTRLRESAAREDKGEGGSSIGDRSTARRDRSAALGMTKDLGGSVVAHSSQKRA